MAFHDVRLPEDIEQGATGGPRFKTNILILSSGFEQRNIEFEETRGFWNIGYGIQTKVDFNTVLEFFFARQGRANSFRFKDFSDFEIGIDPEDSSDDPQTIGTGDIVETNFQISRLYDDGSFTFNRTITKIVASPVPRVFLDAAEQFSGFTVNLLTGIVNFSVAPGAGVLVRIICEFDVAVRFDTDALDLNLTHFNAGTIPRVPVIEVRGE